MPLTKPAILVVQISEAFCHFWNDLAADVVADIELVTDSASSPTSHGAAVILLAAGGAEVEAQDWLEAHDVSPDVAVFAVGSNSSRRTAIKLVSRGARDYFALPDDVELLRNAVEAQVRLHRQFLESETTQSDDLRTSAFDTIVGESPAITALLAQASRIAPHPRANVLITGETGTGKELLARAIHFAGRRGGAPFVPVDCSALPDHLVESELFGHERGAFTDAHSTKPGLFEIADGGSLFLDEIGELPLELQAKLLRAIDGKEIRRVGGTKTRPIDVRIIAATNADLATAVEQRTFREDLFFRLSVVTLSLPPLRERGDDITLIANALLLRLAAEHDVAVPILMPEARSRLLASDWPGNVRELKNVLERALLLSPEGEISLAELHTRHRTASRHAAPRFPFPAPLEVIVRNAARAMLDFCGGNWSESARQLGITRKRLKRILGVGNRVDSIDVRQGKAHSATSLTGRPHS